MTFKEKVYNATKEALLVKIQRLQAIADDLKNSASNETKSTAGDKHETALAMLQIEQENTNRQLQQLFLQKIIIDKINPLLQTVTVTTGSLVTTNHGNYYISIPIGKLLVDEVPVIALSADAPLARYLTGLHPGSSFQFNNVEYLINSIE